MVSAVAIARATFAVVMVWWCSEGLVVGGDPPFAFFVFVDVDCFDGCFGGVDEGEQRVGSDGGMETASFGKRLIVRLFAKLGEVDLPSHAVVRLRVRRLWSLIL
jgi:hypothetical protein